MDISKTCCFCKKKFMGYGNNPAPLKDEGVCCDDCNKQYVIPKRFDLLIKEREE